MTFGHEQLEGRLSNTVQDVIEVYGIGRIDTDSDPDADKP
jgi:serine kinase of HPr protein (carbohydrate metabolism regulator)